MSWWLPLEGRVCHRNDLPEEATTTTLLGWFWLEDGRPWGGVFLASSGSEGGMFAVMVREGGVSLGFGTNVRSSQSRDWEFRQSSFARDKSFFERS